MIQRSGPRRGENRKRDSFVEISGSLGLIRITFESSHSPQLRRAIVRGFFRHNKAWLRYFRSIAFEHSEHVNVDPHHAEKRGFPLFKNKNFDTPSGHLGSEIQIRRLIIGLTQAELARRTGMQQASISKIERGLMTVRPSTYKRLLEATRPETSSVTFEDLLLSE
jgi:DNA-binding XRE family transcriptional regulator